MNNQNNKKNRCDIKSVVLQLVIIVTLIFQPVSNVYATEEVVTEEVTTEEVTTEEVTTEEVTTEEVTTEEVTTEETASVGLVIEVPTSQNTIGANVVPVMQSASMESAEPVVMSEITYPYTESTTGDFQLILPTSEVEKTMDVTILIPRTKQGNETYTVSINGTSEAKEFVLGWNSGLATNVLSLTLTGVAQGSKILIEDIITTLDTVENEYHTSNDVTESEVYVAVSYTGGTAMENATLAAVGENPVTLVTDETITMEYQVTTGQLTATTIIAPDTGTYGNFQLILPEETADGAEVLMNATIYIVRTEQDDTNENYLVTITDTSGTVITSQVMQFIHSWSSSVYGSEHLALELTNLPDGATVAVQNIIVTKDVGGVNGEGSNDITQVGVALTNTDGTTWNEEIQSLGNNPIQLEASDTRIIKFLNSANEDYMGSMYQTIVTTDFDDSHVHVEDNKEGEHQIRCLINSFNVFSFTDIEATHIIGPIMAQESAYYKRETPVSTTLSSDKLIASDYSRGVPSFVGNIIANAIGSRAFALNYAYDLLYDSAFDYPNLFTSENIYLINGGTEDSPQEYVLTDTDSTPFKSPNNDGQTPILQNDDYLDFDTLYDDIVAESIALVEDGNIEDSTVNEVKIFDSSVDGSVLTVNAGESWNVTDASQLTQVDIIIPEEYDYFMNPYPFATTISISDTTINPTTMGGLTVSQFPLATINGAEYDITHLGEFTEYNEFGNKIIWNMPYIVTDEDGNNRVVTYADGQNIPGHMIMPQAEFWNYHEDSNGALVWEGGNINGSIIAKDFHSGLAEMHMWAYDGRSENGTYFEAKAVKTVNGNTPEESFQFTLEPTGGVDQVQAGNLNNNFPLVATSDEEGNIYFSTLVFNVAGTYTYYIEEIIPEDTGTITYDRSKYELTVVVSEMEDGSFSATGTYTKIQDDIGEALNIAIETVSFNNLDSAVAAFPSTGGNGKEIYLLLGVTFLLISSRLRSRKAILI